MVTTESEALAILQGSIPNPTVLSLRVQSALEMLKEIDTRKAEEAERLAIENELFGRHDNSQINGKPHHLGQPLHGGVEVNLGFRRP